MSVVLYMSISVEGFMASPDDDLDDGNPGSCRPESGLNATVFDEMIGTVR